VRARVPTAVSVDLAEDRLHALEDLYNESRADTREMNRMRTTGVEKTAASLVGIEALGLALLLIWQIVALASGDTGSVESAIALAVLTAVGCAAVAAFAVAVWRDESWGRSGGIVVQLLLLAVALGAVTGSYAHPVTALALALPALAAGGCLVAAVRASARRRGGPAAGPV
jgi:multisubunit Na+/H+ antiporter MnhF subunit